LYKVQNEKELLEQKIARATCLNPLEKISEDLGELIKLGTVTPEKFSSILDQIQDASFMFTSLQLRLNQSQLLLLLC